MFIWRDLAQLEKAIRRARSYRPRVRALRFGLYSVTGQRGSDYQVACYRDAQGRRVLDCNCPTLDGVACKHAAAALPLHLHLAATRRKLRQRPRK